MGKLKSIFTLTFVFYAVWGHVLPDVASTVSSQEKHINFDSQNIKGSLTNTEKDLNESNGNSTKREIISSSGKNTLFEDAVQLTDTNEKNVRSVRQIMVYSDVLGLPYHWRNVLLPHTKILTGLHSRVQNQTAHFDSALKKNPVDAHNHGTARKLVTCYSRDRRPFEGFACDHENCVPLDWVCDGDVDCETGADEEHCQNRKCPNDKLHCIVRGRPSCLPSERLCDGHIDCHDGSDEVVQNCRIYGSENQYCRNGYFRCRNGRGCIPANQVCDWEEDCQDGSDEQRCQIPTNICRNELHFPCYKSLSGGRNTKCIPKVWVCDDHEDCPEGEDESVEACRTSNAVSRTRNFFVPLYFTNFHNPTPFVQFK